MGKDRNETPITRENFNHFRSGFTLIKNKIFLGLEAKYMNGSDFA